MAYPTRKRKCPHCKTFFHPDYRNVTRQRLCSKPDCRQASKVDAQQRWQQKPENLDYFKGDEHVQRVRQWRLEHPGYWRRKTSKASKTPDALQDTLTTQGIENQTFEASLAEDKKDALQDSFFMQPAVLVGLIAHLTGLALQEDIASTARRLQQLGHDILHRSPRATGGQHDAQTPHLFRQTQEATPAIQLGRSAPGP
jgi:phage terminase large subunit GpA-like protein